MCGVACERAPAGVLSDVGAPDLGAPDLGAPDLSAPDLSAPDLSAPDLSAPDLGAPDLGAPESAPYTLTLYEQTPIYSYGAENFQEALSELALRGGPYERVTLTVELHTTCFPFEGWASDPPPEGQSWPPSCDAFDRNFELHLSPEGAPLDPRTGAPAEVEVMRAITPFGGPARHTLDLTDYANAYGGLSRARLHITTWSDAAGQVSGSAGMWRVSARAEVTPGPAPRRVIAAVPLFNLTHRLADGPLEGSFEVPEGVTRARLEYRATGHGGASDPSPRCVGPAEEFCRRTHIVGAEGRDLETLWPWRDDCALGCTLARYERADGSGFDYCAENPMGAIESVRAPRANWCPGSLTPPFEWDVPAFTRAGSRSYYFEVPDAHPEGVWRLSAVVYLLGD